MPITIYKDGNNRRVFPVDLAGWLANGWQLEPVVITPADPEVTDSDPLNSDPEPTPPVKPRKSAGSNPA